MALYFSTVWGMTMKTVLNVNGMKCGCCEATVNSTVSACAGVTAVKADHRAKTVEIEYDENAANLEAIKQAISGQGFQIV
jgi:copper chaperone CopZ